MTKGKGDRRLAIVSGVLIPLVGLSLGFLYWKSTRHTEAVLVLDGVYLVGESGWCIHDASETSPDEDMDVHNYTRHLVRQLAGPSNLPYYRLEMFCPDAVLSRGAKPQKGPTIDVSFRNTGNAIAHLHSLEVATLDYTDIGPLAGGTHLFPSTEVAIPVTVPKAGLVHIALSETVSGDDAIRLQFYLTLPNDSAPSHPDYNYKRCLTRLSIRYNETQLPFAVLSFLYGPDLPEMPANKALQRPVRSASRR